MSDHERANEVPLEDLRLDAQQHYRELSDQGHVWRSDIPQAIDFYFEAKKIERAALAVSRPAPETEIRLAELVALPENWDSYNASRITPEAVEAVRRLLGRSPHIIPMHTGGLQLEWLNGDAVIEIMPDGRVWEENPRALDGAGEAQPVAWGIFEGERFIYGARQRDTLAADEYLRDHSTYSCHALYLCPAAMRTQP